MGTPELCCKLGNVRSLIKLVRQPSRTICYKKFAKNVQRCQSTFLDLNFKLFYAHASKKLFLTFFPKIFFCMLKILKCT